MGKRLSKIVTRTGDDGCTGMADGSRIAKSSARLESIGAVDELNSQLGLLLAEMDGAFQGELQDYLRQVQNELFDLGGELAMPGHVLVLETAWKTIEEKIDWLNNSLDPLENFILPGGSRLVAQCHVTRAVARRAERRYVALCESIAEEAGDALVNDNSRIYLNRLSDLLFVAARWLARERGEAEILWQQRKPD